MISVTDSHIMQLLALWREAGWLRSVDYALAEWLQQAGEQNQGVLLLAALTSHQAGRGHTSLALEKLIEEPKATLNLPPENAYAHECPLPSVVIEQQLSHDWQASLRDSLSIDDRGDGQQPLVLDGQQLFLRRYWYYERFIEQQLDLRMQDKPVFCEELLASTLSKLFNPTNEVNWQRAACANTVRNRFSVITGGPGTGKTYTVVRLLTALQQQQLQRGLTPLRVALAAPTGKAAARLTESIEGELKALKHNAELASLRSALESIQAEGKTLHRLLGVRAGTRSFKHNQDNPLRADVVIVDEASMVDIEMMVALLKATPSRARLVLIGDKDQLASVEAGAVLGNLCAGIDEGCYHPETAQWLAQMADSKAFESRLVNSDAPERLQHVVKFRKSYRFTGPIADLANAINEQRHDDTRAELDKARLSGKQHDVQLVEVDDFADERVRQLVKDNQPSISPGDYETFDQYARAALDANSRFQLLTPMREGPWGVKAINQQVGEWLGVNANSWYPGRPIMVTKNDYGLGLSNGDIGMAFKDPEQGHLRVAFPDQQHGVRWVLPSRLTHIETVYAMTVHKSQGSEFAHTVLVLPDTDSPVITKELLYTGITRAKTRLSILGTTINKLLKV